jgi:SAM-dependent methyltransferase
LAPPLRFVVTEPSAHLPFKDESFDFICAISVFTHLKENHVAWLCELLRVLAPNGALYMTVHDETAFGHPDAPGVIGRYFKGIENLGDLSAIRYAAINDYRGGLLAQVYVSRAYIEQLLPIDFEISHEFPRALHTQTGYLIARRSRYRDL